MPILDARTLDFMSHSAAQTHRLGVRLGELLRPGDLICLSGELGTGKTTFAAGVGRGWGVTQPLTSPTFILVNEYPRPGDGLKLYHIDCYRVQDAREALDFGLAEILDAPGIVLIEWAERIQSVLPRERLWITLRYVAETKRGLLFEASGARYERLLADFRRRAFGV